MRGHKLCHLEWGYGSDPLYKNVNNEIEMMLTLASFQTIHHGLVGSYFVFNDVFLLVTIVI